MHLTILNYNSLYKNCEDHYLCGLFLYLYIHMDILIKICQAIVAIAAAVGVLYAIFAYVYSLNKKIQDILDEVKPNDGKSLKEQVTEINSKVNKDSHIINTICSRQKWLLDNRPEPIFECDTSGSCTWVNEKYCQLLQHDIDYFKGNGWKSVVHNADRRKVEEEWNNAIEDKRSSTCEYRMVDREGTVYKVRATATRNENYGYIGHVEVLEEKKDK